MNPNSNSSPDRGQLDTSIESSEPTAAITHGAVSGELAMFTQVIDSSPCPTSVLVDMPVGKDPVVGLRRQRPLNRNVIHSRKFILKSL